MKVLGSTKRRITKYKNGENVPQLETTEAVLVYCNIVNNQCQHDSKVLPIIVPNKSYFGQLLKFNLRLVFTQKHFIQSFHTLKYGLLIKTPCSER